MQFSFAQEKTITGVVSDGTGPLPGVNVVVKGTTKGVSTGFDGAYSIKAKEGETLVFSFMGMREVSKVIGASNVMNTVLQEDSKVIGEVVVTAFNIKRNPKNLGYAVSSVKTEELTENAEPDLSRALNGKVAGVNVNISNGVAGSANQITIRGINTFSGNVQPLVIVDGVAYDISEYATSSQVTGGGGYQSALSSLDPNDIASINVLKSAAASALYGSRAVNGVIVVTTKSGSASKKKGKVSVNVSLGTSLEEIANLPEYQNTYGAGTNFNYGNVNGSWGPRFDSLATIPTWPAYLAAFPGQFGATVAYKAQPNNVKSLFKTGLITDQSIGLNYAGSEGNFGLTVSKLNQEGYIPFNDFDRTSISVGGNFKFNEKFTFGGNLSYSKTGQTGGFFGEQQFPGSSSAFARVLFMARNWDMSLPFERPDGGSVSALPAASDHPLWSLKHDRIETGTHRTVAGFNFDYKFNSNLSAAYRIGINRYVLNRDEIRDRFSRAAGGTGSIQRSDIVNEDLESTFTINYNKKLTDKFGINAIAGSNIYQNKFNYNEVLGTTFILPNIFTLQNMQSLASNADSSSKKRNSGLFGDLSLSYDDIYFLNGTVRNDWSSSLPKNNNSYLYYSASASVIVSEALKINDKYVNLWKIRGSYGKVGRDATAEFLNSTFNINPAFNGQPSVSNSTTLANQALTPEFTTEFEVGTDIEMFNRRFILDLTAYDKKTTDIITPREVTTSTGYSTFNTNVGSMRNKGIEAALTVVPLKTDNFKWSLTTVFTKNENEVLSIDGESERSQLRVNTPSYLIVGQPFGVFYGTKFARDANGSFLINQTTGGVLQDPNEGIIGDPNADFKMSFTNALTYKGFSLRAQVDWKQGGDVSSTTIQQLLGRGVTRDTEDREKTFIIPGFYGNPTTGQPLLDSGGNQIPNQVQLSMNELYFSPANSNTFGINSVDEADIYDGTVFRLREISLTYDMSSKILSKTPFSAVSLSLLGNNLWYFAPNVPKYTNFDPEISSLGTGRAQGVEIASAPTAKRYGFKLNLSF
jgi:TonB-linked SusC/RagA family outer membrane protein